MNHRRQVAAAIGVSAGLLGVPACALFASKNTPPPPAANPGTDPGSLDRDALTGSILVRLNLPARQIMSVVDVIERIEMAVTGPGVTESISAVVTKEQIASGGAAVTVGRIPPGDVTLAAYVRDVRGNVIASSTVAVTVVAGQQTTAMLDITVPLYGSISATITLTGSGTASGSTVVPHEAFPAVTGDQGVLQVGSKYVGATTCKGCHPSHWNAFKATAHWNPREATGNRPGTDIENFSGFVDKKSGANPYLANNSCRSCHVVGDGSAWDVPTRTVIQKPIYLADGTTPAGFDFSQAWNSDYNKPFVGIQCESCHGPGANHVAASSGPDRKNAIIGSPSYKTTCLVCHNKDPWRPWNGAEPLDYNSGGGGAYAPHPQILIYGQGGGFAYDQAIPASAHVAKLGNGCINCHASGAAPTNHTLYLKEKMETAITSCRKCHGETFEEANIQAYQAQTKLAIDGLKKIMSEFRLAYCQEVAEKTSDTDPRNATDSARVGNITKFCTQWDDSPAYVKDAGEASHSNAVKVISNSSQTWSDHMQAFNRANWNKGLIERDASFGIHSPVYVQSLIRLSYNDLQKQLPSSASASYQVLGLRR